MCILGGRSQPIRSFTCGIPGGFRHSEFSLHRDCILTPVRSRVPLPSSLILTYESNITRFGTWRLQLRREKVILIQGEVHHEMATIERPDAEDRESFRVGISGRAFSAVAPGLAPGRYEVEILLAETQYQAGAGQRVLDVTCGEETLAKAFDPVVAAGGAGIPVTIRGQIEHPGDALRGPVTIAFRARAGNALIHAIRVTNSQGSCVASLTARDHQAAYSSDFTILPDVAEPPIYPDPAQPLDKRIDDLMRRMSIQEKVAQMLNDAPGIERLGLSPHNDWNECLHGVGRAGIATVFPQAIGLAATWDPELIGAAADAISTEARAKHHEALRAGELCPLLRAYLLVAQY